MRFALNLRHKHYREYEADAGTADTWLLLRCTLNVLEREATLSVTGESIAGQQWNPRLTQTLPWALACALVGYNPNTDGCT